MSEPQNENTGAQPRRVPMPKVGPRQPVTQQGRGPQIPVSPRPPQPSSTPVSPKPATPSRGPVGPSNSQAGLASHRGGGVPMPKSVPSPGQKGSPFNPVVKERRRELPVDGPDMIRSVPGAGAQMAQEAQAQGEQENESVASAAVQGFGSGFTGAMRTGGDPALDRLGRQQEILSMMREDVELSKQAGEQLPEHERGAWSNIVQRDEMAANRMELDTNDFERDLVVQGKLEAREGLSTRAYDLERLGLQGAMPAGGVAGPGLPGQMVESQAGLSSIGAAGKSAATAKAEKADQVTKDRMNKFPELRNLHDQRDSGQNDGPQMG